MPTKYDEVLYWSGPRKEAHPERLATVAHLMGLKPAPLKQCRVLELGCGDGANLIPIAYEYPGAHCLGMDLAERPLSIGRESTNELGLANIEFVQGDLTTWSAGDREFDYILAHGIYSWVPAAAREGIMRICQQHLAPNGVAFVSYNALPGCYFRKIVWDMLKFHTRDIEGSQAKIAAARDFSAKAMSHLRDNGMTGIIRGELEEVLARHDGGIFHDDLSEINEPFYVEQVTAHAARFGLQYLGDSDAGREHGLPFELTTTSRAQERQYTDFASARRFRETLLCREGLVLEEKIGLDRLKDLWASSDAEAGPVKEDGVQTFTTPKGLELSTNHPAAKAVMQLATGCWPKMIPVRDLPLPGDSPEADLDFLLRLRITGWLEFRLEPPNVVDVTDYPKSSALARAQLAKGLHDVTNQRHQKVDLGDEIARELVMLLDGTRTHTEIEATLEAKIETPGSREEFALKFEAALRSLARLSLLVG